MSKRKSFLSGVFSTWVVGLLFLVFCPGVVSRADKASPQYEKIKAEFLRLRNVDPSTKDVDAWQAIAGRFESFARRNDKHADAPAAIFHMGLIYDQLDEYHDRMGHYEKALQAFSNLVEQYPGSSLADDALLRKGDLLRRLGIKGEAEKSYLELRKRYRSGDMYEVAGERLQTLRNGASAFETVDEREVPEGESTTSGEERGQRVVVLDPGHGGEDFGAAGVGGLLEKDVTLAIALELERRLRKELKASVYLTRRTDVFVPLQERTELANRVKADIFLSLHTNASPQGKLSGLEVYYLDNANDKGSKTLAERENKSVAMGVGDDSDLQFMLSDLIQTGKLDESVRLAHQVQDSVVDFLGTSWGNVQRLGVRKAPFYVLVGAHMPCVLIELFFIDHPEDGKRLAEKRFREDLAFGLLTGIERFIGKTR